MSSDDDSEDEQSPFRERPALSSAEAIEIMSTAEIEVLGRMPYLSLIHI